MDFSTPAGVLSQLGHDILFHKNSLFSHVLADEAPLHTKEVNGIAGASLPGPQGPVGGH